MKMRYYDDDGNEKRKRKQICLPKHLETRVNIDSDHMEHTYATLNERMSMRANIFIPISVYCFHSQWALDRRRV